MVASDSAPIGQLPDDEGRLTEDESLVLPRFTLVVPCFNEEEVLPQFIETVAPLLTEMMDAAVISRDSELLFVDDGSDDRTWNLIVESSLASSNIGGIRLASNLGHQRALLAGYQVAVRTSDIVGSMDADLQDDPLVLPQMVACLASGHEIAVGVRRDRTADSWMKRNTAQFFYRLAGRRLIPDHADYRVMTKPACARVLDTCKAEPFFRGQMRQVTNRIAEVPYLRHRRIAGETKYSATSMVRFARSFFVGDFRALVEFGVKVAAASVLLTVGLFAYGLFGLIFGETVPGWFSLLSAMGAYHSLGFVLMAVVLLKLRTMNDQPMTVSLWIVAQVGHNSER